MNVDQKPGKVILESEDLRKVYSNDLMKGKQIALAGINCKVHEETLTAICGHNGAGKTTFLRVVLGLTKADQGKVLFRGKKIDKKNRVDIGYMPEVNRNAPTLTPFETLDFQLKLYFRGRLAKPKRFENIKNVLTKVGLWEHRHKKNIALSKGMGRRLGWAQATIHRPSLLILDEPFSGLDPLGRNQLKGWIQEMKKEKVTILLCTHELEVWQKLCEHLIVFNSGKIVLDQKLIGQPVPDDIFDYFVPEKVF